MKRTLAAKNFRRSAAVLAVLIALSAVLAPCAGAVYGDGYIEKVANINDYDSTDIDGVTALQAENLMIYLLNKMYPVGSIYMTTEITDPGDMATHFGGSWIRWGEGRIPVGADLTDPDYMFNTMGGGTGGGMGGASNPAVDPVDMPATGTLPAFSNSVTILTAGYRTVGGVTRNDTPGTAAGNYGFAKNFSTSFNGQFTPPLLQHQHGTVGFGYSTFGRTYTNAATAGASAGTPNTNSTGTNNVFAASITSDGPGGNVVYNNTLTISPANYGVAHTFPDTTYRQPTIDDGGGQKLSHNIVVTAEGTVEANDTTVQPYQTCYMYMRMSLADFRS